MRTKLTLALNAALAAGFLLAAGATLAVEPPKREKDEFHFVVLGDSHSMLGVTGYDDAEQALALLESLRK